MVERIHYITINGSDFYMSDAIEYLQENDGSLFDINIEVETNKATYYKTFYTSDEAVEWLERLLP